MKEHPPVLSWARAQAIAERFTRRFGISREVPFYDVGQNVQGLVYVQVVKGKDNVTKSKVRSIAGQQSPSFMYSIGRRGVEMSLVAKKPPPDSNN